MWSAQENSVGHLAYTSCVVNYLGNHLCAHLISNIQREHDSFFFNLVSWTIELGKQQVVYVK